MCFGTITVLLPKRKYSVPWYNVTQDRRRSSSNYQWYQAGYPLKSESHPYFTLVYFDSNYFGPIAWYVEASMKRILVACPLR